MSAAKIIKRAQADGVSIALSPVGTLKISGDPANVSRWVSVVKSHKSEIVDALSILELARADYFTHKETCPVCSLSWAAVASCEEHSDLWLAYHDAMVPLYGADLVDSEPMPSKGPITPEDAPGGADGYCGVITPSARSPAWHRAKEAYYAHLMTCDKCKPSGVCPEGRQLKQEYAVLSAVPFN